MKHLKLYLVALLVLSAAVFGMNKVNTTSKVKYDLVVENLLEGVNSNNTGLVVSSSIMLGDFKSDAAVISLMKILRSSDNESARISAALSLVKIGDSRGVFAVKQAAKFDDSQRVRKMCAKFYSQSELL